MFFLGLEFMSFLFVFGLLPGAKLVLGSVYTVHWWEVCFEAHDLSQLCLGFGLQHFRFELCRVVVKGCGWRFFGMIL